MPSQKVKAVNNFMPGDMVRDGCNHFLVLSSSRVDNFNKELCVYSIVTSKLYRNNKIHNKSVFFTYSI